MSLSRELMICAICRHVATRAVTCQQCSGGIFCEECSRSLMQAGGNSCPNCRHAPLDVRPNRQLRSIIDSANLACTYCHTQVKANTLEEHEEACDLKPRKCGFTGCKFETGHIESALRHLSDAHGLNIWRNFTRLSQAVSEGIENVCITCQNLNEQLETAEQQAGDLKTKEEIHLRLLEMYRKEISELKSKLDQETMNAVTAEAHLAELRGVQQTQEKRARQKEESLKLKLKSLEEELSTTRIDFEADVRAFELSMRGAMQRLTGRHLLGGIDGSMWGPPGACSALGATALAGAAPGSALTFSSSTITDEHSIGEDCCAPAPPAPGLAVNCTGEGAHESLNFLTSIDFNPRLSPHCQYQYLTMGAAAAAAPRQMASNANAACQTSTVTAEAAAQLGLLLMFQGEASSEEVAEIELEAVDANDAASSVSADDVISAN